MHAVRYLPFSFLATSPNQQPLEEPPEALPEALTEALPEAQPTAWRPHVDGLSLRMALSGACAGYLPPMWLYAGLAPTPDVPHEVLLPKLLVRPMTDDYLRATASASVVGGVGVGVWLGLHLARAFQAQGSASERLLGTLVGSLGVSLLGSVGAPALAVLSRAALGSLPPASVNEPGAAYLLSAAIFGIGAAWAKHRLRPVPAGLLPIADAAHPASRGTSIELT